MLLMRVFWGEKQLRSETKLGVFFAALEMDMMPPEFFLGDFER
jgi:hypothetical protein